MTDYKVDEYGRIISPGKFEGEMLYAAKLWEEANDVGETYMSACDDVSFVVLELTDDKIEEYNIPKKVSNSLFSNSKKYSKAACKTVGLLFQEEESGFVYCQPIGANEIDKLKRELEIM